MKKKEITKKKKTGLKPKPKAKTRAKVQDKPPNTKLFQWTIIKEDYIVQNLEIARKFTKKGSSVDLDYNKLIKQGFTLKDVAKKYKLHHGTVRTRASNEGWRNQLRVRIADLNEKTACVALAKLNTEVEGVRTRQASIARLCVSKAVMALRKLKPSALTPGELIKYIQIGLSEERKALGIPEKIEIKHTTPKEDMNFQTVADHITSHQEKMQLMAVIADLIQENKKLQGTDVIDV